MDQNTQTPPPVSGGENNDKVMAIVAYILFFIPLIAVKNRSAFLNFHVNQGLSLFIVALIGNIVLGAFGFTFMVFSNIWSLAMVLLVVMGIINASKNEMKPLPVIGEWFHLIK